MNRAKFEVLVSRVLNLVPGTIVEITYGETSKGQHYGLIINRVLWYAVRLVLEVDERFGECVFGEKLSEHLTLVGAQEKCSEIGKKFASDVPIYPKFSRAASQVKAFRFSQVVPPEVVDDPDKYLKAGDHICISRGAYHHEAIYMGNREVIQVPNTTDPIRQDSWKAFLSESPKKISYYIYLVRMKTAEEILKTARNYVGKRGNEYNLLSKNCQHFSSLCCTGEEIADELSPHDGQLDKNHNGTLCRIWFEAQATTQPMLYATRF